MGFPVSLIWSVGHIKANLPYRLCADLRTELSWTDREVSKCSGNKNTLDTQTETDKTEKNPKKNQLGQKTVLNKLETFLVCPKKLFLHWRLTYYSAINFCCPIGWDFPLWVMNICAFEKSSALYDFSIWVFLLIGLFHLLLLVEF